MSLSENERVRLKEMLDSCHEKYGELDFDQLIHTSMCDSCTGSCKGHGISVWTACDVK